MQWVIALTLGQPSSSLLTSVVKREYLDWGLSFQNCPTLQYSYNFPDYQPYHLFYHSTFVTPVVIIWIYRIISDLPLIVCIWTSYLSSIKCNFLNSKMEINILAISMAVIAIKWNTVVYGEHLACTWYIVRVQ